MINLEEFKLKLGSRASQMTEEQIVELRDTQYQLAGILFDSWLIARQTKYSSPRSND